MTFIWWYHGQLQVNNSAGWCTIVTSLAVTTSKEMSLCCSKLIRKISHQKKCNTQIHISTEVKLPQIKLIPFLNPQKISLKVKNYSVPSGYFPAPFFREKLASPCFSYPPLPLPPNLESRKFIPLFWWFPSLKLVLHCFPTNSQPTCNFPIYL